jgi:6-pyruvoyltetrahydropterin/6-carboxytetrahydropterin synthase
MIIGKKFTFESAHYLPNHDRCGKMHGHTYELTVEVEGPVNTRTEMVMDLHSLSDIVRKVLWEYDHNELNNFFTKPTCEVVIESLALAIRMDLPLEVKLHRLQLQEGAGGYAIWNK